MTSIAHDLAKILPTIRSHGEFYATGTSDISIPNLEIDSVGRISLPLLAVQAEQLIAIAAQSPYGRGKETIIDTDVRKTWQIAPESVHLSGRNWSKTLDAIVAQAAAGLGVEEAVSAELYKLLIYDTGSFFVEHRDTEKVAGMFATLVVVLPSVCSGGELIVRHRDREVCLDLNRSESTEVSFAAFYADCVHEVRPVTSGYRLTLIYNLVRKKKGGKPLTLPAYDKERAKITAMLQHWVANKNAPDNDSPEKLIYPLEHAYTPAELGFDALKNADAAAAAVLVAAAKDAACDLYLALVSIEESGTAEHTDYKPRGRSRWHRHRHEDDEEDLEVVEVYDRTLTVSDWRLPDGSQPAMNALPFHEEELCPPDTFVDAEPDEQHFHEATGNEGASFERTYRRAALVLWPQAYKLAVLNQGGLSLTLPYLADMANRWTASAEGNDSPIWQDAHKLSGYMLRDWPARSGYQGTEKTSKAAYLLSSLEQLRNTVRIDAFLGDIVVKGIYSGRENEALVGAATLLLPDRAATHMEQIIAKNAQLMAGACAHLLKCLSVVKKFVGSKTHPQTLLYPAATTLVDILLSERANLPPLERWARPAPVDASLIDDLLTALCHIGATSLADRVTSHMLANPQSFSLDNIVIPAVMRLTENQQTKNIDSVKRLRAACLSHLHARIALPLAPPANFERTSAVACRCSHCIELSRFLANSTQKTWAFKASEHHRSHVSSSIRENGCDLDCVTSTNGRPYSLVCTKNQASYERRVRQRKSDLEYVKRLDVGGDPKTADVKTRRTA